VHLSRESLVKLVYQESQETKEILEPEESPVTKEIRE
jgi:hypothetical protein